MGFNQETVTIRFKEKASSQWIAAKQLQNITQQFGEWILAQNKLGYWLVSESYTMGQCSFGLYLGEEKDQDYLDAISAFEAQDTDKLFEIFEYRE